MDQKHQEFVVDWAQPPSAPLPPPDSVRYFPDFSPEEEMRVVFTHPQPIADVPSQD